MEVDSNVIANRPSRIYHRTAGRRVRALDAFRAWPAGTCLCWNAGFASWTIRSADRKGGRRFLRGQGPGPWPLLGPWGEGVASLAPHGDFLAPRRVHSPAWGLGAGSSPLLVCGLSPHGALVLWWLRGGGVSQPPLSALLHGLLPAQCHRPARAPIHAPGKRSGGSGLRPSQCQRRERRRAAFLSLERRSSPMKTSHYRFPVRLSEEQRRFLETMMHTSITPAKHYLVARVLLMSDQSQGEPEATDGQIAGALSISRRTVIRIKQRFVQENLEVALTGSFPRERPERRCLDGKGGAQLIHLACSQP